MSEQEKIQLFEDQKIRTAWDPVPEAIWWISGSKLLVPPFIEGFLSYLREYLKELEVM